MVRKISRVENTSIEYFVSGKNPRLLLQTGIHGDEYEVIDFVKSAIEKYANQLPSLLYIPATSPSALVKKTRHNINGRDLNRCFLHEISEDEAKANVQIVKGERFDLLASFHEDVQFSQFYMYDSKDRESEPSWLNLKRRVQSLGISLLTGADDPHDPALNFVFNEGYCYCPSLFDTPFDGTIEDWLVKTGTVQEWIMPELPKTVKRRVKEQIVTAVFEEFIIPIFT